MVQATTRTALVTGAAGFIGSHLTEALLEAGWRVRGLDAFLEWNDRARKEDNLAELERRRDFALTRADLRDIPEAALSTLVEGCDAVFHLAALPGVRTSWGDAFREYTSHNVEATARLLEVSKKVAVPRFVYASSSSVYGDAERFPAREADATGPISPYGVTKLAGEHLARLYARNFGLFSVSLRFFTVYGPRQRPDMAFHRFIRGVLTGQPNRIFGDGEQTRDFTFVSDAVASCLGALDAPKPGSVYNVGGGSRVSVKRVIEIIEHHVGRPGHWSFEPAEAGDPRHTAADTSLARTEIGYNPRVGLEEGLGRQVAWMARRLGGERAPA